MTAYVLELTNKMLVGIFMDRGEVCEAIKALHPGREIRINMTKKLTYRNLCAAFKEDNFVSIGIMAEPDKAPRALNIIAVPVGALLRDGSGREIK